MITTFTYQADGSKSYPTVFWKVVVSDNPASRVESEVYSYTIDE